MENREAAKKAAAKRAVDEVENGMVVGLGSGSTAEYAIQEIGDREIDVTGVATSMQAHESAEEAGVEVVQMFEVESIDLVIDGADQVCGDVCIKGGGGAHAKEQVVAKMADRVIVVVDSAKIVDGITHAVPVEVLPIAVQYIEQQVRAAGGRVSLRPNPHRPGPFITENGATILDCDFGMIEEPRALAEALSGMAGMVSHGLCIGLYDVVYVGQEDGSVCESV